MPVAIYLVALAFLHARPWTASVLAPILVACALMLAATLAAPVVGVPVVVLVIALVACGLVVEMVARARPA